MEEQAALAEGPGVVFREVQEEVVGLSVPGFNQNVVLQDLTPFSPAGNRKNCVNSPLISTSIENL